MQKKPISSKVLKVTVFPPPESPVTITMFGLLTKVKPYLAGSIRP
jgi:hypothetical protein